MSVKVVTWQDPAGNKISLTPAQQRRLEAARAWPRTAHGEYCTVSHGLHFGEASLSDAEVDELCGKTACEHEWHRFGTVNGKDDVACQKCGVAQC